MRVCARCIRSGLVRKTQKQAPFKLPVAPVAKTMPVAKASAKK
jgi:hypothetical protein